MCSWDIRNSEIPISDLRKWLEGKVGSDFSWETWLGKTTMLLMANNLFVAITFVYDIIFELAKMAKIV